MSTQLEWKKKNFKSVWVAATGPFKLSVRRAAMYEGYYWEIRGFKETISGTQDLPILAMERAEERLIHKPLDVQIDLFGYRKRR